VPKPESLTTSANAATTSTPVDTSEKVRYERAPLRVSVEDKSPAYLTPQQKLASKKLYNLTIEILTVDSLLWIN
jgi:hypothetical protein